MTQTKPAQADLRIDEMPWLEFINPLPIDLPYDDGELTKSPWHAASGSLLKREAELRVLRGEATQP
jgi:hypothetical protein